VRALGLRLAAEQRLNWWLSLRAGLGWTSLRREGPADGAAEPGTADPVDASVGLGLHLGAWGADLAAGNAPLPAPWRWLRDAPGRRTWLRAAVHHDF
jgi:hypothetical protein